MAVDTDTVDTVDTTVERDPLMLNPKPKPPLLPNPKPMLMPMPTTDTVDTMAVDTVDTTAEDTVMVDTDTVTITARDLPKLNLLPITVMVDTDTAVDTEDTVMADMVIMVDLFKKNSQLLKKNEFLCQ